MRYGKRVLPIILGKVGKVVDGVFVPDENPRLKDAAQARAEKLARLRGGEQKDTTGRPDASLSIGGLDCREYGRFKLRDNLCKDLLTDLAGHFGLEDAKTDYVAALQRSVDSGDTDNDLVSDYGNTYASVAYPGLRLGAMAAFLQGWGDGGAESEASCGTGPGGTLAAWLP